MRAELQLTIGVPAVPVQGPRRGRRRVRQGGQTDILGRVGPAGHQGAKHAQRHEAPHDSPCGQIS